MIGNFRQGALRFGVAARHGHGQAARSVLVAHVKGNPHAQERVDVSDIARTWTFL